MGCASGSGRCTCTLKSQQWCVSTPNLQPLFRTHHPLTIQQVQPKRDKLNQAQAELEVTEALLRDKEAAARQKFVAAVTQIIGDYMVQRGATAIVDKKAIIVSLLSIDITMDIVALIDQKLGDGTAKP